MMYYYFNSMQSFGTGNDTWWDLPVFNFWSNKDQVKLSSESPDNSYSKDLCMSITPLLVGEVTIVLPYTFFGGEGIFGPVILRIKIYQYIP